MKSDQLIFRTEVNQNYTLKYSPNRAVNTLRLGYTNQSVNAVQGNNCSLFSDPHKKDINTLCGQNVQLLNVKLAVYKDPVPTAQ